MLFVTLPYQTSQHLKQISENTTNHLKQEVNRITLCIKKATDVALNHHGYYRGLYSSPVSNGSKLSTFNMYLVYNTWMTIAK